MALDQADPAVLSPRGTLTERVNIAMTREMRAEIQQIAAERQTQESTVVRQAVATLIEQRRRERAIT